MGEVIKMKGIAENLVYWLNKRGVSQARLAEHCGVATSSVNYWCKGKTTPTVANLQKIAELLNIDVQDLVGEKAGAEAPANAALTYDFLVENQYIKEGEDLTRSDLGFLGAVDTVIRSYFKK